MKNNADALIFYTTICAGASQIVLITAEKMQSIFLGVSPTLNASEWRNKMSEMENRFDQVPDPNTTEKNAQESNGYGQSVYNQNENSQSEYEKNAYNQNAYGQNTTGNYYYGQNGSGQYVPNVEVEENSNTGIAMAITSLVMGGISILCCCAFGLTLIPALLGLVFAIVALVRGRKNVRVMGGIGLGLNIVGLLLAIYMLVSMALSINWENMTIENFNTIEQINPNDEEAIEEWTQQFFNVPID